MILQSDFYTIPDYSENNEDSKTINLLGVIDESGQKHMKLISKILAATKLPTEDYHICINNPKNGHIQSLISSFNPSHVILFGIHPKDLGLHVSIKSYQPITIQNVKIVLAHPPDQLSEQANYKKALWSILKEWFHV